MTKVLTEGEEEAGVRHHCNVLFWSSRQPLSKGACPNLHKCTTSKKRLFRACLHTPPTGTMRTAATYSCLLVALSSCPCLGCYSPIVCCDRKSLYAQSTTLEAHLNLRLCFPGIIFPKAIFITVNKTEVHSRKLLLDLSDRPSLVARVHLSRHVLP